MSSLSEIEARNHIMDIRRSYIAQSGRILEALTGAIRVIEKTFARSGHFILEFIQNAEDADATKVKIVLQRDAVKIFNNGNPFSKEDVEGICSVGRSRKDPRKHIGYLGVGFKAVFQISSSPRIYSKPYRFKFDRNYWPKPEEIPWQITPIWLDDVPEEFKEWNVGFYIPIDEKGYERIKRELENLHPTLLLFIHKVDEIELEFDNIRRIFKRRVKERSENYTIYTLEVEEGGDKKVTDWVVFRQVVEIPDHIREDRFTKDWDRSSVQYREIAVAFGLDDSGDLMAVPETARFGVKFGVFSYLPLKGEEHVPLPYYIHADFLVAPGREVIHRDAPWNIWMLDEIANFIIRSVIESFKSHPTWRYSYTSVLYVDRYYVPEPFYSHLIKPVNDEIMSGAHYPTIDEDFVRTSDVVKVDQKIIESLGLDLVKEIIKRVAGKGMLNPKAKIPRALELKEVKEIRDLRKYLEGIPLEKLKELFKDKWDEWGERIIELLEPSDLINKLRDPNVSDEEKIRIVKELKRRWSKGIVSSEELLKGGFLIRTKSGKWIRPQEALLPSEYRPLKEDVERLVKRGLLDPGLVEERFVDSVFIESVPDPEKEIDEWRRFLEELKVGSEVDRRRLVENVGIMVALKYEREVLGVKDARPLTESERGKGYDIESRMPDGSPKYIEVKARSGDYYESITLARSEYELLFNKPECTYVYVVLNALSDPVLHIVPGKELKDVKSAVEFSWNEWNPKVKQKWKPP
jgi:hypothetical protein